MVKSHWSEPKRCHIKRRRVSKTCQCTPSSIYLFLFFPLMEAKSFGQAPLVRAQTLSYKEEKGLQDLSMHALFHILANVQIGKSRFFPQLPLQQQGLSLCHNFHMVFHAFSYSFLSHCHFQFQLHDILQRRDSHLGHCMRP